MGEKEDSEGPVKDYMDCIQLGICFHAPQTSKVSPEDLEDYNERPMVCCGECDAWYHPICDDYFDAEVQHFEDWFCSRCRAQNESLKVTYRTVKYTAFQNPFEVETHLEEYEKSNFCDETGAPIVEVGTDEFIVRHRREIDEPGRYPDGREIYNVGDREINEEYFDKNGFDEPIFFPAESNRTPDGLWISDEKHFDVDDVFKHVGPDYLMRYTDSLTQEPYKTSFAKWQKYFKNKDDNSMRFLGNSQINKRYNVISLEYSKTSLTDYVRPPNIFSRLAWQELWPKQDRHGNSTYNTANEPPSFMNYCLMGTKNSYSDWHIDLGGTSVWYHIHYGGKIFILVRPTSTNLKLYIDWENSDPDVKKRTPFLAYCEKMERPIPKSDICKLELRPRDTALIPSGWIHNVLTTADSLVFGGNCLNTYCAQMQIKCREVELKTNMPEKYCLSGFTKLHWYAANDLYKQLKTANRNRTKFPKVKLDAIRTIRTYLNRMKNKTEHIPESIAPESLLDKIRRTIRIRENYEKDGVMYEECSFRPPTIDKSEIGTVVDFDQDDKLFFADTKRTTAPPPPTSKRRAKAQTKFAEALKELKSDEPGIYEPNRIGETFIPDAESDDLEDADIPSDEDWNDVSDLAQSPFLTKKPKLSRTISPIMKSPKKSKSKSAVKEERFMKLVKNLK